MMARKIYLAGKFEPNCWRNQIVKGFQDVVDGFIYSDYPTENDWPILEKAIFDKYDFVGPFWDGREVFGPLHPAIANICQKALSKTDIVFAWLGEGNEYNILSEIAYAHALEKVVWVSGPHMYTPDDFIFGVNLTGGYSPLFEFVDGEYIFGGTPEEGLRKCLENWEPVLVVLDRAELCESPIEKLFYEAACWELQELIPQYQIGRYRVDFAIPEHRVVIEIDGHDFHKTKEQRTRDAEQQRYLELNGWRVIRFTGSEVYKSVARCVNEAAGLIDLWG